MNPVMWNLVQTSQYVMSWWFILQEWLACNELLPSPSYPLWQMKDTKKNKLLECNKFIVYNDHVIIFLVILQGIFIWETIILFINNNFIYWLHGFVKKILVFKRETTCKYCINNIDFRTTCFLLFEFSHNINLLGLYGCVKY